jgi:hypothetical protein
MCGSGPHVVFGPQPFETDGLDDVQMDAEPGAPAVAAPGPSASAASDSVPKSVVRYRAGTLVFIKAAAGSFEEVFLAQLMEPVVEERVHVPRGRNRRERVRLKFAIEKPRVRFFSLRGGEDESAESWRYEYDPCTMVTVNAAAIHGAVESYNNDVVSAKGDLLAFDVDELELDRMQGVVNEQPESSSSSEDSEAEEQTPALQRQKAKQQQAAHFSNPFVLPEGSVRSRAPPTGGSDQIARYREVAGRSYK